MLQKIRSHTHRRCLAAKETNYYDLDYAVAWLSATDTLYVGPRGIH
jgi:hypothetical protein